MPLFLLSSWISILLWLALAILGVPLLLIDLEHHRLPDILTGWLFAIALLIILAHAVQQNHYDRIVPSLIGAVSLIAFYLLLLLISRGGMGMGDVKLSGSIGVISGYFGFRAILASSYIAFFLGALIGIALMILGKAGRKTAIPFGPFMIVGQFISLIIYAH